MTYPPQQQPAWGPAPPQPPKKSRTGLKVFLIVTAIFVGLCFVGGVAAVLSGDTDTSVDTGTAADDTAANEPEAKTAGIGEAARDGKFEFTVVKLKTGVNNVGGEWGENAQGEFVLVTLKVKNIGDEAQMLDDSNMYAYDAKGRKYEADGAAGIYANEEDGAFLNDINPGNEVTAVIVFDVPKGTKLTKLELHDSAFSGGIEVKL